MKRTQLYLDETVHQRLSALAQRQGRTVSDMVREAITIAYGTEVTDRRLGTLKDVASLWQDRKDLGPTDAYVRRLRRDSRQAKRT